MRKVILLLFSLSSFCLPLIHAEEDDLDAAFDSAFIDLAELTGEERKETIQRLCKSEDSEAALPLISVLTEPANEDSDKTLEQVFSALMRFKSKEIEEELKQLLQSPDPRLQGFGFKIYARTYGKSGARELLSWLSRAQGPAFQDLIAALRNCPVPATVKVLRRLLPKTKDKIEIYLTLLRLGVPDFSAEILNYYATASSTIRTLREGLKYPSDKRKAARDRIHIQKLIRQKADARAELLLTPDVGIRGFCEAASRQSHQDVWSLLARLIPRIIHDDNIHLFQPLLQSQSVEVSTLVLEKIAASKSPKVKEVLKAQIPILAKASSSEMRKLAVRYSGRVDVGTRTEMVLSLLNDPDKWVRIESIEKLAEWRIEEARATIEKMKATDDPDIQWSTDYAMKLFEGSDEGHE